MNRAAETNAQLGLEQAALARQQYADAQKRQAIFDPKFSAMIDAALKSQQTQDDRSAQQWDQYTTTFMPAEKKLADASMSYDTPGRREEVAGQARAGVANEFAAARDEFGRTLGRRGVSLSSGNGASLAMSGQLAEAKASAAADRSARNQVEATGLSLLDNTVKTGRGLASTGLQAAGLALNAGGTAGGGLGQQQSTYNASMAPAANFYSGATGSTNSAAGIFGTVAKIQQQSQSQGLAGLAGLGPLGTTLLLGSSKDFKDPVGKVSGKAARKSLEDAPVERWRYKPGMFDGAEHIGPYVEDMEGSGATKGKALDVISTLGLHHAAIADVSKELKKLNRRLSLADAATSEA